MRKTVKVNLHIKYACVHVYNIHTYKHVCLDMCKVPIHTPIFLVHRKKTVFSPGVICHLHASESPGGLINKCWSLSPTPHLLNEALESEPKDGCLLAPLSTSAWPWVTLIHTSASGPLTRSGSSLGGRIRTFLVVRKILYWTYAAFMIKSSLKVY